MAELGLAARGGLALVGVAATQYADKNFDQYAYNLKLSDTRSVKVTPGLMLTAATLLAAWAFPKARPVLGSLAIGGGASEVAPIIKTELVDQLPGPAVKGFPAGRQAGAFPPHYQHVGYGPFAGDRALAQAMLRWGAPG